MKTKEKTLNINSPAYKVKNRIAELEHELSKLNGGAENLDSPGLYARRNEIKSELKYLQRLRHKQKNYTPPPTRVNLKKGL